MPGKVNLSAEEFGLKVEAQVNAKYDAALVKMLCYVGEQCLKEARENGSYMDRTGNLRSSIGYAVVRDGVVVRRGYGGRTKNVTEGEAEGKAFLSSRINKTAKKGLVLIVTAGMNYAEYVEARGYNVLTSAELKADKLVRTMLVNLGFKLK